MSETHKMFVGTTQRRRRDPLTTNPQPPPTLLLLALLATTAGCPDHNSSARRERGQAVKPTTPPKTALRRAPNPLVTGLALVGRIPLDYPVVGTSARKGDFVLAVPSKWIRRAFEQGANRQSFLLYGGWMLQPGPKQSKIRNRDGELDTIPNSVIIPIRRGERTRPGDILLTAWASGFGMQRAVVVRGKGRSNRPAVRYLDMKYENPAGIARETDRLEPNTFHRLLGGMQPGTSVAIRDERGFRHGVVINVQQEKVLVIGFGRKLEVTARSDCVLLPMHPRLRRGDAVSVPYLGHFYPGTVKRVVHRIGRVFVSFQHEGQARTVAVGYSNVIRPLAAPDQAVVDAGLMELGTTK